MNKKLQIGQKVRYTNDRGKQATGVIFGIRQAERSSGFVLGNTYLIDTGGAVREDKTLVDRNDRKLNELINAAMDKLPTNHSLADRAEASREITTKHKHLLKPDIEEVIVRQPEQVERLAEQITGL